LTTTSSSDMVDDVGVDADQSDAAMIYEFGKIQEI
jgi:hypothetical protein